ncbi:hypothetical protein CN179_29325, partial [Sinorhizobium medicae]
NGSRQRHSSPSSLASGSSTDETGPPHRIPDSPETAPRTSGRSHLRKPLCGDICRPRRQPRSQHWIAPKDTAGEGGSANQFSQFACPASRKGSLNAQTSLTDGLRLDNHQ